MSLISVQATPVSPISAVELPVRLLGNVEHYERTLGVGFFHETCPAKKNIEQR